MLLAISTAVALAAPGTSRASAIARWLARKPSIRLELTASDRRRGEATSS
jgi:hypothetical protein